ncbi:MAG TPA: PEP/pyruvate-binding domain-containing protein, partial [Polyangiaceae bacterium]|nr:PEP/pyruvate-binding domain-containing protein [Polyangiaceae bacterium]
MATAKTRFTIPFRELGLADITRVGGKNASLGELICSLSALGVRVPDGFAVSAEAFIEHISKNDLGDFIYPLLDQLDVSDLAALAKTGDRIRSAIRNQPLPEPIAEQIRNAYRALSESSGETDVDVAVRSSATAEDLPTASFAGQQETYLNVRGEAQLLHAVRDCM